MEDAMTTSPKRGCIFCLVLLLASSLPAMSQVLKLPAVLYPSGGSPAQSLVLADVNRDGKPDAVVVNGSGSLGVLLGNGDGTFRASVTYATGLRAANALIVGDLNGDGWPDVVVANNDGYCLTGCLSVLLNNGDGTFQNAVIYSSGGFDIYSLAIADVDGDGKADLVVANECGPSLCQSSYIGVLLGNGDGTFRSVTTYTLTGSLYALSVAVADLNHDGKPDLLVAAESSNGAGTVTVFLNKGDGTFPTQMSYSTGGYGGGSVITADVNGDGKIDAVVTNYVFSSTIQSYGSVGVLLGNGDGTFGKVAVYPVGLSPYPAATGDFNGDGALDIVVGDAAKFGYPNVLGKVQVLMNKGNGTFITPATSFSTGGFNAYSVAVANLNSDGNPDVVIADGCDNYQDSCPSGGVAVLLGRADKTTTAITSSSNPSSLGQSVTFTAKITGSSSPVPNGTTVEFLSDYKQIGTGTTTNGIAKFTTSSLTSGTHLIKAKYPSSTFFEASSATLEQVVN
jgi:hypothetical protein